MPNCRPTGRNLRLVGFAEGILLVNRMSLRLLSALVMAGSVAAWAACSDTTGENSSPGTAQLTVRPVLPAAVASAAFNLAVDQVRIRVIRPPAEPVLDTLLFFPADSSQLAVHL